MNRVFFVCGYLVTNIYFTVTHTYYDDLISTLRSLCCCSKHRYKYEILGYRDSDFREYLKFSGPSTLKIEAINIFEILRKFVAYYNASYSRT